MNLTFFRRGFPLALLAAFLVASRAQVLAKFLPPGNHTVSIYHAGGERSAIVHLPSHATRQWQLPLILNFHGGGGHATNQQEYSMMDRFADREGFVAAYPNGTGRFGNRLLTWNAGSCCGYAAMNNVGDVDFVRALIGKLAEVAPIDRRRIYATGLSNGGMMAHRLASEAGDLIAAVAPVAGAMVAATIKSGRAVPVMHIHSVDDPRALYAGGLGPPFPFTKAQVFHPSVEEMVARWTQHNHCTPDPNVVKRRHDADTRGHTAERFEYGNCRDGAEVVLWKLTGAGHVWPGGKQKFMERLLGPSTDIIDANQEMWNFFKRFSL